jgi:hypothetical protein
MFGYTVSGCAPIGPVALASVELLSGQNVVRASALAPLPVPSAPLLK